MPTDKVYRVTANDTNLNKIKNLNDMVIYLEGLVEQGKFDKNELDHLYNLIDTSRKFKRNQGIGNTTATYTGWTHLKEEDGYSIWYYIQSTYSYNISNQVYFDGQILSDKGQADSESATSFDKVYVYDGSYADYTTEAATEGGTQFTLIDAIGEYLYLGEAATFAGAKFEWQTRGSNYTLVVEYWNGAAWTTMTANDNDLDDDTNSFESNGRITWTVPSNWGTTAVNGQTKYWIRISTSTTPVTAAKAYYIIPGNSVIALLALSSTEIINEDWAWCSCAAEATRIYVTVRNSGATAYEGDYYINSSSSSTNKENFFIHNHPYTADYVDTNYDAVITKSADYNVLATDGTVLGDTNGGSITFYLPTAVGREGKRFTFKKIDAANTLGINGQNAETVDGKSNRVLKDDNHCITVESNGTGWEIVYSHTLSLSWSSSSSSLSSSSSSSSSLSSSSSSSSSSLSSSSSSSSSSSFSSTSSSSTTP